MAKGKKKAGKSFANHAKNHGKCKGWSNVLNPKQTEPAEHMSVDDTLEGLLHIKERAKHVVSKTVYEPSTVSEPAHFAISEDAPLCFVTGASGRLGRQLVKELLKSGYRVRVLHRDDAQHARDYPHGVEVVNGSLFNSVSLEHAVQEVQYVFHLAALISYTEPMERLLDVNFRGTLKLLEAVRNKCYSLKKFVFVSTTGVYGKAPLKLPADEKTHPSPSDNYSRSKLIAEEKIYEYFGKFPITIMRPAVIYGEGYDEPYFTLLKALEKRSMPIIGEGNNFVPFVNVTDVAHALILAAESKLSDKQIYVLSSEERWTQKQLMEEVCRLLGVPPPKEKTSLWMLRLKFQFAGLLGPITGKKPKLTIEDLNVIASDRYFDIAKAKSQLGYTQGVRLADGIAEMVGAYKASKR